MSDHRAPRRVALTLALDERAALRAIASRRCEPEATTAARFVRAGLMGDGAELDDPPQRRSGPKPSPQRDVSAGDECPWLPASERTTAVARVCERYRDDLRRVPERLGDDRALAERLSALSVWRDEIDAGLHRDPRVELAFSDELARTSRWLEERRRRTR
jgi:hypothetical protein